MDLPMAELMKLAEMVGVMHTLSGAPGAGFLPEKNLRGKRQ